MTEQHSTKAPAEKICAYEYTVKRGDSFYLIAHRLGIPLRDLLAANPEVNPARLMVGDVLCIPLEEDDRPQEGEHAAPAPAETPPEPPPAPSAPTQPPETEAPAGTPSPAEAVPDAVELELEEQQVPLGALDHPAEPEPGPVLDSGTVCPRENRYVLRDGETLADVQLARGLTWHTLESANPAADLTQLKAGAEICLPEENIPCPLPRSVTLCAEDTLERVALRYNLSVGALLRANPCLAPADFVPGVSVVLPQ